MIAKSVAVGLALALSGCEASSRNATIVKSNGKSGGVSVTSDPTIFANSLTTLQNSPKSDKI
jgi:hypothetical protein